MRISQPDDQEPHTDISVCDKVASGFIMIEIYDVGPAFVETEFTLSLVKTGSMHNIIISQNWIYIAHIRPY